MYTHLKAVKMSLDAPHARLVLFTLASIACRCKCTCITNKPEIFQAFLKTRCAIKQSKKQKISTQNQRTNKNICKIPLFSPQARGENTKAIFIHFARASVYRYSKKWSMEKGR